MKNANSINEQLKQKALEVKGQLHRNDYQKIAQRSGTAISTVKSTFSPASKYVHVDVVAAAVKLVNRRQKLAHKLVNN
jgi:hypothetical protein